MKKFNEINESSKKKDKYEFIFDGNIGYVSDKKTGNIIVYSKTELGQEFLKESVEKMNSN